MASNAGKVREELRKNAAKTPQVEIYRLAGVEIDPSRASLSREGEALHLRPKTYRFLLYLLDHRNRLVTKEEIVSGVWEGAAVSDDVLVRSVTELRKAFGEDPKDPAIFKTFPKLGYGLMAPVDVIFRGELSVAPVAHPVSEASAPPTANLRLTVAIAAGALALVAAGAWWWLARPLHPPYREAAWWKMDQSGGTAALDSSGYANTGRIAGNAKWVPGQRGNALWFDGLASRVSGRNVSLPSGGAPRTITAWFKVALPFVDSATIFDHGSEFRGPTFERWTLGITPDGRLWSGPNSTGGNLVGARNWSDGAWHFVAASYAGVSTGRAAILVDGHPDADGRLNGAVATSRGGEWRIGMSLLGSSAFQGAIRDVRVYPYAIRKPWLIAMYRCTAGIQDLDSYYYLPVYDWDTNMEARGAGDASTPVGNAERDLAGIQLARSDGNCALTSLEGADVGQDLHMAVDLLVPQDGSRGTLAGPYFRSRLAAAGDGLIGGTSAGYWVQLLSSGMVKVRRFNPWAVVAFAEAAPAFDPTIFHRIEVEAVGSLLTVWLDGHTLLFNQGGALVDRVAIPPTWEGPPRIGVNQGAAGISFGTAEAADRGKAGGQRARNLQVRRIAGRGSGQ